MVRRLRHDRLDTDHSDDHELHDWHHRRIVCERLGANAVPVQLPIGSEDKFEGIIDIVRLKAIRYLDELGREYEENDISKEMRPAALEAREHLVEKVAEIDEYLTPR